MAMGDSDPQKAEKSELWSALDWQQNQAHHFQEMARGILALLAATLSVSILILTSLFAQSFEPLLSDYSGVPSAVSGTVFGKYAGVVIVGFSMFILAIFTIIFFISLIKSIWGFGNVIFEFSLKNGIEFPTNDNGENVEGEFSSVLTSSLLYNQNRLLEIKQGYVTASARLILSITGVFAIFALYIHIINLNIWALAVMNIFAFVPVQLFSGLKRYLSGWIFDGGDEESETGYELDSINQIVSDLSFSKSEKILNLVLSVFNLIVIVTVAISLIAGVAF